MDWDDWPDCHIKGCTNKICLGLSSEFCFPHTPGNQHVKRMKIAARNGTPLDELTPVHELYKT